MSKASPISQKEFNSVKADLYQVLVKQLQQQKAECFIPDTPDDTDVFDTPEVDSKTVIKLTSVIEKRTGHKLKLQWVRKGGYASIEAAATHVIDQIQANCYAPKTVSAKPVREAVPV
jgi:acyl carrier protein